MSTQAVVTVGLQSSPLPTANKAQAGFSFSFVDAAGVAGTPVTVPNPAAGASVVEATLDVSKAIAGVATFSVQAIDITGAAIGSPVTGTAQVGAVAPSVYLAPQSPLSITVS